MQSVLNLFTNNIFVSDNPKYLNLRTTCYLSLAISKILPALLVTRYVLRFLRVYFPPAFYSVDGGKSSRESKDRAVKFASPLHIVLRLIIIGDIPLFDPSGRVA